jgi:2,4-dienoyl-CoA reductase-like NADH-dependent reductase (Old Yellow Enzyme family)/thioredoxin reductase
MLPEQFEHLLSPLALGPVELRNRIVSTSHQTNLVSAHAPTDDFVAYHETRARGGVGLIVLEATAMHESGLLHAHTLAGYRDEIVDGYRRVAERVHRHGSKLFVQLFHGGREQIASPPRPQAVAPSAVPSQRFKTEPRALTEAEIEELIAGYARAARLAADGGLDGVEISAAHNYLVAQFFTPALNARTDRWRAGPAFLLAVAEAVRAAAPGIALGVRLSADSIAAQAVAHELTGRVDYLSLALGESSTYRGSTGIVPPPPTPENAIADLTESFRVGPPIVATSRIVDPLEAERILAEGRADAVGMTRALIVDPDLPAKVASRRLAEIVRCTGCNACIAHYHAGTPIGCSMNPRTGRERALPRPDGRARRTRVLVVIGAGPAGLAAAAEACASGHRAVVFERAPTIGGQLALAGAAPMHEETARTHLANARRLVAEAELRLGVDGDVQEVAELAPDGVVVATGAAPYRPPLPLNGRVLSAWEVLAGGSVEGPRAVVADWSGDPSGLAAADVLSARGVQVTVALAAVAAGESIHQYTRNVYLERLYRAGVRIEHHLELVEATAGRAVFRNLFAPDLETELVADTVVLALGRVPVDGLASRLRADGLTVEEAGDCRSPRSLEEATLEGTLAVRRLLSSLS